MRVGRRRMTRESSLTRLLYHHPCYRQLAPGPAPPSLEYRGSRPSGELAASSAMGEQGIRDTRVAPSAHPAVRLVSDKMAALITKVIPRC